jgi:hypothetical protein
MEETKELLLSFIYCYLGIATIFVAVVLGNEVRKKKKVQRDEEEGEKPDALASAAPLARERELQFRAVSSGPPIRISVELNGWLFLESPYKSMHDLFLEIVPNNDRHFMEHATGVMGYFFAARHLEAVLSVHPDAELLPPLDGIADYLMEVVRRVRISIAPPLEGVFIESPYRFTHDQFTMLVPYNERSFIEHPDTGEAGWLFAARYLEAVLSMYPDAELLWPLDLVADQIIEAVHARTAAEEKARKADRATKRRRSGLPLGLRFDVFKRDSYCCQICGAKQINGATLEVDHKVPVTKGGNNDMSNLWTLCFDCNRGKSDKDL